MTRNEQKKSDIRDFVIFNVEKHRKDIGKLLAEKFGISRVTAVKHLQALIDEGILEAEGKTRNRIYLLKELINRIWRFDVSPDLHEDIVWREHIKPALVGTNENVMAICAHGLTEMLNNVVSHSESPVAILHVVKNAARILMYVNDEGVGIFRKIQTKFNLADPQHALLELAKGKLTTDEKHHAGEGIFFTCRMFDEFMISSDAIDFCRFTSNDTWFFEDRKEPVKGTRVMMKISVYAKQTVREIFDTYRAEFDTYGFSKTIIPLVLMQYEGEQLISRSQAKRLLSRADRFKEVFLDFKGITAIGQAFADEVFRVYPAEHPGVSLNYIHASDEILNMIRRVQGGREDQPLLFNADNERSNLD